MALRGMRRVFGLVRILHQNDAAGLLDGAHPDGAVRAGAGQDDRETVAVLRGQRAEEQIDRRALAARLVEPAVEISWSEMLQAAIGRNDVDVVRLAGFSAAPTWVTGMWCASPGSLGSRCGFADRDARSPRTPRRCRRAARQRTTAAPELRPPTRRCRR